MSELSVSAQGDRGCSFGIRVTPRARRSEIVGVEEGILLVRLNAPPVEGKANQALFELLAAQLKLRRSQLKLVMGDKSRHKVVHVEGLGVDALRTQLQMTGSPSTKE